MRKRCIGAAVGLLCLPSVAWAGAWTLPQGTGQWLTTFTAATSTMQFPDSGVGLAPTPRYNKYEVQALVEFGLTDRLTAIFEPGLQHIDIAPPTDASRTGLNYTEFGARYGFYADPTWVFSGQATLRIPGTDQTSNPAAIGYTDVEADIRALLGHNFKVWDRYGFFDVEVAQRVRTNGYADEFHADGTIGIRIFPRWLLLAQSFNVASEGAGISLFGGSYDYEKLQLSAVYSLTDVWALQFGGYTTYAGRNALQENGLIFAVWRQF
jgi:protein XagA